MKQPVAWKGSPSIALRDRRSAMSTLTIRQLDERTHARLRVRAAKHGRSVGAEVRAILDAAVHLPERNFLLSLRDVVADVGGLDLELSPRTDKPRPAGVS